MIRRNPTRIELKMEDIQEYEKIKKERESRKLAQKNSLLGVSPAGHQPSDIVPAPAKHTLDTIHQRIGFDPTPRLN